MTDVNQQYILTDNNHLPWEMTTLYFWEMEKPKPMTDDNQTMTLTYVNPDR